MWLNQHFLWKAQFCLEWGKMTFYYDLCLFNYAAKIKKNKSHPLIFTISFVVKFFLLVSLYCTLNWELGLFSQLTPTILGRSGSDVLVTLLLLLLFSDVDPVTESCAGATAIPLSDLSFPEIVIFLMDLETAEGEATFWFRWSSAAMCSWTRFTGATCLTMGETRQGPCAQTWDRLR